MVSTSTPHNWASFCGVKCRSSADIAGCILFGSSLTGRVQTCERFRNCSDTLPFRMRQLMEIYDKAHPHA